MIEPIVEQKGHLITLFIVSHNGENIIQYHELEVGRVLGAGQPHYEELESRAAAKARIDELSGSSEYWNTHYQEDYPV